MSRLRTTFQALSSRNYRLYFTGHGISVTGQWMQKIGQAWLVLELTDSGTLLGITAALQHMPTLLAGSWGGLLADRLDKRHLLLWTNTIGGLLALTLGILTVTGVVGVWMVLALAFALGTNQAIDHPARQSFVMEMVGPGRLTNALTLASVAHNAAKVTGPTMAGLLIATVGLASSFFVNAASFLAVIVALLLMRPQELSLNARARRGRGQLREGFRYVGQTPELLGPLLLMAVSGMFAYEWSVTIPLFARDAFDGDAQTFGVMFSAMGIGAVAGGLLVAGWLRPSTRALMASGWTFGGVLLLTSTSATLPIAIAVLVLLGGTSIAFRAVATSFLQLRSAPEMRGRVMALLAMAMMGTTPVGAPLAGWIAETMGARVALALGGMATLLATVAAFWYLRRCVAIEAAASLPGQPMLPAPSANYGPPSRLDSSSDSMNGISGGSQSCQPP